jgi:hypothetical protein
VQLTRPMAGLALLHLHITGKIAVPPRPSPDARRTFVLRLTMPSMCRLQQQLSATAALREIDSGSLPLSDP